VAEWFKAPVGVGTIAVTAVFTATSMAAPHSLAFFEFVVHQAAAFRDYFAVASQNPQLTRVIDAIEYVCIKLSSPDR
jgi:hypothetical protein